MLSVGREDNVLPTKAYHFPDLVEDEVDDLLAHGVVASGVVVGRVLLPADQLVWVEQLLELSRPHLV